jgi:hypothetical protein
VTGGRSTEQLAGVIRGYLRGCDIGAEQLLGQLERDGIAERDGDLWRLTAEVERTLGAAFRSLALPAEREWVAEDTETLTVNTSEVVTCCSTASKRRLPLCCPARQISLSHAEFLPRSRVEISVREVESDPQQQWPRRRANAPRPGTGGTSSHA